MAVINREALVDLFHDKTVENEQKSFQFGFDVDEKDESVDEVLNAKSQPLQIVKKTPASATPAVVKHKVSKKITFFRPDERLHELGRRLILRQQDSAIQSMFI